MEVIDNKNDISNKKEIEKKQLEIMLQLEEINKKLKTIENIEDRKEINNDERITLIKQELNEIRKKQYQIKEEEKEKALLEEEEAEQQQQQQQQQQNGAEKN